MDDSFDIVDEDKGDKKIKIKNILEAVNVADLLTESQLTSVAHNIRQRLNLDKRSMESWLRDGASAMKLCTMEKEPKDYPRRNAANIKYPLLSTAQLQFSSRAAPEILKNGQLVESLVIGSDPTGYKARKGERKKKFYNGYILTKIKGFADTLDKLLNQESMVGTSFLETYYDYSEKVIKVSLIPYNDIFVNMGITDLEHAETISKYTYLTTNRIVENIRSGYFREIDLEKLKLDPQDPEAVEHQLICAQTWLDLDGDDYKEPYYVVLHDSSNEVLQILPRFEETDVVYNSDKEVQRISAEQYFSDVHFIMSPDGSFFGPAFGTMLLDIADTVNTAYNQLIDAGYFANAQGGIITKACRIEKETLDMERGSWIVAEGMDGSTLADNIYPINYKEPSQVLFSLAQSLIDSARALTGTTEVVTGQADTTNASPNTVFELINQSLKVNNAIIKRTIRGISKVVDKIVSLYEKNPDVMEYLRIVQPSEADLLEMFGPNGEFLDFMPGDVDIVLSADVTMSTDSENLIKAQQALMAGMQLIPTGAINYKQLSLDVFKALQLPNPERYIMPDPDPNQPNPVMIQLQSELDMRARQLELKEREMELKERDLAIRENQAKYENQETLTKAVKNIADAEAAEVGVQLDQYTAAAGLIDKAFSIDVANREQERLDNEQAQLQAASIASAPGPAPTTPVDGTSGDQGAPPVPTGP